MKKPENERVISTTVTNYHLLDTQRSHGFLVVKDGLSFEFIPAQINQLRQNDNTSVVKPNQVKPTNPIGGKKIVKEKKKLVIKQKVDIIIANINGKVKRISKEDYNKYLKFNRKVNKLKKVIKADNYAYPEALKYTEKYIKKYGNKKFTITEIARMIYEDNF